MATSIIENPQPYVPRDSVENSAYLELVTCPLCQGILWKPVSCQCCEASYCLSCIINWQIDTPNSTRCQNTSCAAYIQRSCLAVVSHILCRLKVKCRYTISGCNATLLYSNLETHEEICGYQQKTCSGCQQQIAKKDFKNHEITCPLVTITCDQCKDVCMRQDQEKHTEIICLRFQLNQQNKRLTQLESRLNSFMDDRTQLSVQNISISEINE